MVRIAREGRSIPDPTPTAAPFFEAAREGRFLIQNCPRDGFFFYPRLHCPHCWQQDWAWLEGSGHGRVHAYTIDRLGHDPQQADLAPFIIAIVDLDEGVRAAAQIIDCPFDEIENGMRVQAVFEAYSPADGGQDVPTLRFKPLTDGAGRPPFRSERAAAVQPRNEE